MQNEGFILSDPVLYDVADGIATITLNRPEKLNALNKAAVAELFTAWQRFEQDREALVAVFTGAGDRALCVGRDLSEPTHGEFKLQSFPIIGLSVEVTKPTIAAVNGMALGGGFLFAQMCDLCIAADHASFSIPEARLGRGAAWAAQLSALLPPRVVMQMLVTGLPMTATRMYELGFVNEVVPRAELQAHARTIAGAIAANAPLSVRACRKMVRTFYTPQAMPLDPTSAEALFAHVYLSEDAREGQLAFQQKRKPVWQAR